MRLTKRGERVLGLLMLAGFVALFLVVNWLLTPDSCGGDVATLSQGCKDLLYP